VDWSFLDADDGPPGEPADWVKKQSRLFERETDDGEVRDMIKEMNRRHRWTRSILPPSTPRYNPNQPPIDSQDIFGDDDLGI